MTCCDQVVFFNKSSNQERNLDVDYVVDSGTRMTNQMLVTLHIVPVQHNDSLYYGNTSNSVASAAIKFVNISSPF